MLKFVRLLMTVSLLCLSSLCVAQNYPSKPIKLIVPFPVGGPTDVLARTLAQKLSEAWNQPVVVDNVVGANGVIAQSLAAKAPPDGYTIFTHSVAYVVNPLLYKVEYNNERDFIPASLAASFPQVLVINPSVPARSLKTLVDLAKSNPGKLNYASYGQGSIAQLAAELMNQGAGINTTHILYKGAPQTITDTIGGQVDMTFSSLAVALPFIKSGQLYPIAVTSSKRSKLLPNTPTFSESGIPNYEASSWFGFFYPKGTPQFIVEQLHKSINKILQMPDIKAQFSAQGFEEMDIGPDKFPLFLKNETRKYEEIIKTAKIKLE